MFLPSGAFSDALAKLKTWSSLTSRICFSLFFFFSSFAIFEALLEKTESLKEIQDYVIAAALEAVVAERASCVRGQRSAIPMAHWWKGPAPCPADAFPVPACSVCEAWLVPSHPSPSFHWDTCLTSEQDVEQESNFFFFGRISFLWAEWIEHSLCGEIREERRGWSAWWGQRATMAGAQLHWVTAAERSMNFVKAVTKERPKERKKKFTFAWFFCTQANKILFAFLVHRQYYT